MKHNNTVLFRYIFGGVFLVNTPCLSTATPQPAPLPAQATPQGVTLITQTPESYLVTVANLPAPPTVTEKTTLDAAQQAKRCTAFTPKAGVSLVLIEEDGTQKDLNRNERLIFRPEPMALPNGTGTSTFEAYKHVLVRHGANDKVEIIEQKPCDNAQCSNITTKYEIRAKKDGKIVSALEQSNVAVIFCTPPNNKTYTTTGASGRKTLAIKLKEHAANPTWNALRITARDNAQSMLAHEPSIVCQNGAKLIISHDATRKTYTLSCDPLTNEIKHTFSADVIPELTVRIFDKNQSLASANTDLHVENVSAAAITSTAQPPPPPVQPAASAK